MDRETKLIGSVAGLVGVFMGRQAGVGLEMAHWVD